MTDTRAKPGIKAEGPQTEPKPGRCNAKLRNSRNGEASLYCPSYPVTGHTRCRMHGGASPSGPAHPSWTGRGRSKALPLRLAERVSQHLTDPEATEMLFDIALVSARIDELLAQFDTGEAGHAWLQVSRSLDAVTRVVEKPETTVEEIRQDVRAHLAAITAAIDSGANERNLFNEIFEVQKHRAKLVETELKREERLEQTLTAKQAVAFIGVLKQLLFEFVQDPQQRMAAANRLTALLMKRSPATSAPSPKLLEAAIERVDAPSAEEVPDHEIVEQEPV